MIEQCDDNESLFGLVGNANEIKHPGWSNTTFVLWNNETKSVLMRASYQAEILNIKFSQGRVFVVFASYTLTLAIETDTFEEINALETENPWGAFAVSPGVDPVAVIPSRITGTVKMQTEYAEAPKKFRVTGPFRFHESHISQLSVSKDSRIVVSASERGTLLRIFETENGTAIKEVRRGSTQARIYSICISDSNDMIATTSNRGTCHIFWVKKDNTHSALSSSRMPSFLPSFVNDAMPVYFNSEWSSSQLQITSDKSIAYFTNDDTMLVIISVNGTFTKIHVEASETGHLNLTLKESIKFFP